jgi:tRNA 2-thiouridine synthesizing protein A
MAEEAVPTPTRVVDARGSHCPGPLMELIKAVKAAQVGDVIAVLSSDSGSARDIPLWAQKAGQRYLGAFPEEGHTRFVVQKVH